MEDTSIFYSLLVVFLISLTFPYADTMNLLDGLNNDHKLGNITSPCKYREDPLYENGLVVECQSLGLTFIDPSWFPPETTTINLRNNSLHGLQDFAFSNNHVLRKLILSNCHLTNITPYLFFGLDKLEVLELDYNRMRLASLSPLVFRNLSSLAKLNVGNNYNGRFEEEYPEGLLRGLKNLTHLTLDTFHGSLNFGDLFEDLTSLTDLFLTGGMYLIKNDSFKGFEKIPLKNLTSWRAELYFGIESNAFQYLIHLNALTVTHSIQIITNALNSFFPLQRRNFTTITFNKVYVSLSASPFINFGYRLTNHMTRYLSTICVKHFSLTSARIFVLEKGVFFSPVWQRCLVTLDLSNNPLMGEKLESFLLPFMKTLTVFKLSNCDIWDHFSFQTPSSRSSTTANYTFTEISSSSLNDEFTLPSTDVQLRADVQNKALREDRPNNPILQYSQERTRDFSDKERGQIIIYPFPPKLQFLQWSGCGHRALTFDKHFFFENADHVQHLDVSDNGIENFFNPIQGLTNVSYVDISYNDGRGFSVNFLDSLASVRHLRLAGMKLYEALSRDSGFEIFNKLVNLENIDLSSNKLIFFDATFLRTNSQLKSLNLSSNKLGSLPSNLHFLPMLQTLDMTDNSIEFLSHSEIDKLDAQVKRGVNFSLRLSGNILSCGCSNIRFLAWLKNSPIKLDHDRDYPCIFQNRLMATTRKQFKNLEALWRTCAGEDAFYLAIILLTLMTSSYLLCYFFVNFQTFIITGIVRMFTNSLNLKSAKDYQYGVYIGYSDKDYRFACFSLRKFIEDALALTTYVKHRDLLPASDVAESIVEATNSSWRVLLLVTEDLLNNDHWGYFTLKTSVYCVDTLNPNRILLLVERGTFDKIPRSLLNVVPENNILVVDKPFILGPEERNFLCSVVNNKFK